MIIATTPPIEAIKYHAGSFVLQAGQRVRVGAMTLSQLRQVIQIRQRRTKTQNKTIQFFVL
jgi:hypothetical protein